MFVLQEDNSACVFCSLSSELLFICDKIDADSFKDESKPSLKENDGLKISQNVALNNARENGRPRRKLYYKLMKEKYVLIPSLAYPHIENLFSLNISWQDPQLCYIFW